MKRMGDDQKDQLLMQTKGRFEEAIMTMTKTRAGAKFVSSRSATTYLQSGPKRMLCRVAWIAAVIISSSRHEVVDPYLLPIPYIYTPTWVLTLTST